MENTFTCQTAIDFLMNEAKPIIVNDEMVAASGFDEFDFDVFCQADIDSLLIDDDLIDFVLFTLPEADNVQSS